MITEEDNNAINALLAKLVQAWATGDGQAYGNLFWEDAHYVEAPGFRVIGSKVIAERHQKIFDTFFKHTRIDGKYPRELQVLTPDVVLLHAEGNVYFPGEEGKNLPPNGLMTMCLLKRNNLWKIASFQNTPAGKFRKFKFIYRFFRSRLHPVPS